MTIIIVQGGKSNCGLSNNMQGPTQRWIKHFLEGTPTLNLTKFSQKGNLPEFIQRNSDQSPDRDQTEYYFCIKLSSNYSTKCCTKCTHYNSHNHFH